MKRAYNDFKEISDILLRMEKLILDTSNESYDHDKNICQTYIRHINDDIIELMKLYLDNENDQYAIKVIESTRKNLSDMNHTVFDMIDPTTFDNLTFLRFKQRIINWINEYKEKIDDVMMNYYVICSEEKSQE